MGKCLSGYSQLSFWQQAPRRGAAADKNRADWAFGRHVSFEITDRLDVFRQQLRELGYSEGKDLAF